MRARLQELPTCTRLGFKCPACQCLHWVNVRLKNKSEGPLWEWNGSLENPTLSPSILVSYGDYTPPDRPKVCHPHVRDGHISFCADSTHEFAGCNSMSIPVLA